MFLLMFASLTEDQQELILKIFKDNKKYFYCIAYKMLHSDTDAWEAVSIATLKIIENIEKISNIPCPRMTAFCVTIVKNTAIDMIRRSKRSLHLEELENISDETAVSFEESYIHNTEVERLSKIIETLPEEEKILVQLKYSQEMSYSEIGALLNITEDAAKKRGQRLLKKLKTRYEVE